MSWRHSYHIDRVLRNERRKNQRPSSCMGPGADRRGRGLRGPTKSGLQVRPGVHAHHLAALDDHAGQEAQSPSNPALLDPEPASELGQGHWTIEIDVRGGGIQSDTSDGGFGAAAGVLGGSDGPGLGGRAERSFGRRRPRHCSHAGNRYTEPGSPRCSTYTIGGRGAEILPGGTGAPSGLKPGREPSVPQSLCRCGVKTGG